MLTVIYSFKIKEGENKSFEKAWLELTKLIYRYEGSLGSRLHQESKTHYIAYAQWPSKKVFDASGSKMPTEANEWKNLMRDTCEEIKILHQIDMKEDYLQKEVFKEEGK